MSSSSFQPLRFFEDHSKTYQFWGASRLIAALFLAFVGGLAAQMNCGCCLRSVSELLPLRLPSGEVTVRKRCRHWWLKRLFFHAGWCRTCLFSCLLVLTVDCLWSWRRIWIFLRTRLALKESGLKCWELGGFRGLLRDIWVLRFHRLTHRSNSAKILSDSRFYPTLTESQNIQRASFSWTSDRYHSLSLQSHATQNLR